MDDKRIEEIFEYISDANIELDPDPIRRGPKYLNSMVAKTRNLTNEVQKFERESSKVKMRLERKLYKLEAEYELRYNDLLANDPTVRSKTSVRDREAAANSYLSQLRQDIAELNIQITDMGHVQTVIKSKLKELKSVNSDIRLQMKLIEDEISLGNYWGDQSDDGQHHIEPEEVDLDAEIPANHFGRSYEQAREEFDAEIGSATSEEEDDFLSALDDIEVKTSDQTSEGPMIDYDDLLGEL